MQDKHCHVRAEFRNQSWARVLVGYLPRWASVKPKGIGKDTYQERKRTRSASAPSSVMQ